LVICASVTETKLSNNAWKILVLPPLHTPYAFSPMRKVDEQNEKKKTSRARKGKREREKERRENNRGKSDAFYFEFLRPLNKFAGAPSTVKKFIGRLHALIGDVYRAAIFSSRNTSLARPLRPLPPSFVSVVDAALSARAHVCLRCRESVSLSLFLFLFFFLFF